jgi:hypothetical protein
MRRIGSAKRCVVLRKNFLKSFPVLKFACYVVGGQGDSNMKAAETHFEQVPKAIVEKILARQTGPSETNFAENSGSIKPDAGGARTSNSLSKEHGASMDRAAAIPTVKSTVSSARGKRMDSSNDDVLELLEQNASWWEQAALTCEQIAANHGLGTKEEWQLMGAVYRERAQRHAQIIDQLRQKVGPRR